MHDTITATPIDTSHDDCAAVPAASETLIASDDMIAGQCTKCGGPHREVVLGEDLILGDNVRIFDDHMGIVS
jgi:hypothetical protein